MNELLTKLYYGQINISDQKPKTVRSDAESNLFDKLQERLSKDNFNVFQEFLLSQNVPIQTVSRYMGHSDSTVTLEVYAHFIPDTQEKVIDALDKLF